MHQDAISHYATLLDTINEPPIFALHEQKWQVIADVLEDSRDVVARLERAQVYRLDPDAVHMLSELVAGMKDRIGDFFRACRLPFEDIWLEMSPKGTRQQQAALISQQGDVITVRVMALNGSRFSPGLMELEFGPKGSFVRQTAHMRQAMMPGSGNDPEHFKDVAEDHRQQDILFFGLAMAMSHLLPYRGMLETRLIPALSRSERRRLERKGRPLPARRIQRIVLGDFGKGQLLAQKGEARSHSGRRRAHWVRGHFMYFQNGGISWRMPHIRGAGPLIKQERRVSAPHASP